MPYNNLPLLGFNAGKQIHNAPAPPSGKDEVRTAAGKRAGVVWPAAPVRRLVRALRRRLAVHLGASHNSLREQEERQFNLLTHYVNSRSRQ